MKEKEKDKILIVDDAPGFLITMRTILEREGYDVTTAEDGLKAIEIVKKHEFDLILADLKLPGKDGIEVMKEASKNDPFATGIIITAYASLDTAIGAIRENCYDYVQKPYQVKDLLQRIKKGMEKRKLEKEVVALKVQAEFLNDLMSHDINNMNQTIVGYLGLLLKSGLTEEQREYVEEVQSTMSRSSKLIGNVRKLRQIRGIEPELKAVDLVSVLKKSIEEVKTSHEEKEVTIKFGYEKGKKQYILADSFVSDVFSNILDNAVRFTSSAEVEIDVRVEDYIKNGDEFFKVSIEDRGRGVQDEAKEAIFNRFFKEEQKGSGLGLYLVKTLINRYSGEVWVEDRVKGDYTQGSIFNVAIPKSKLN